MDLAQLRCFVAVAEELHFGRAARRLRISQPPLSRQIRRLEDELDVRLFERTNRRVALTEAGRVLLTDARRLLTEADRARVAAQRAARGETGRLSLGFIESATYDLLPRVLRPFRRRFPHVQLAFHEMNSGVQLRALREGLIDVGFSRRPSSEEGLSTRVIRREPFVVILPKSHPLARKRQVPLRALENEPFILQPREPRPSHIEIVIALCEKAGFRPPVIHETQETQTTLSLVEAGMGITVLPASVRLVPRPGLAYRVLAPPTPMSELVIVHRAADISPVLRAFIATVVALESKDR